MGGVEVHSDCVFTEREGRSEGFILFFKDYFIIYLCVHVCTWTCGGQRSALSVVPREPLSFETGSLIGTGAYLLD